MKLGTTIVALTLAAAGLAVLPACQSSEAQVVPASAMQTSTGKGDVSYTAADPGTVYVYNRTWNQLVYSGPIESGQQVKVDTFAGKVYVGGRVVTEHPLGGDDHFAIYLDRHTQTTITRDVHEYRHEEQATERP